MRYLTIFLLMAISSITHSQVMLPAYQAIQSNVVRAIPTVTTTAMSNVSGTGASSGGNVTLSGITAVTAKGVCWSTSPNPTVTSGNVTTDGTGTGSFTSSFTGLTLYTTYYLRAYATNNAGTAYGEEISFIAAVKAGDSYQGGKIMHVFTADDGSAYDPNVQHGFIGVLLPGTYQWSTSSKNITGTSISFGTGANNTVAIYSQVGTTGTYAAKACYDYVSDGYDDWFLPSAFDVNSIVTSSDWNPTIFGDITTNDYFWASSRNGTSFTAWAPNLVAPYTATFPAMTAQGKVIAYRKF